MKEGDTAPDFSLPDQQGNTINLSDFKGKWLVLYFYPKDNTPGCTIEALDFTARKKQFEEAGATVLGISKDSPKSHQRFCEKRELSITLLADEDHSMQESYGVWRPKKFMGREFLGTVRSTFIIDPQRIIRKIWDPVKARGHAQEVLETLQELTK